MAPDLDVLIRSAEDPLLGLMMHRHFTHALLFAPVGALVTALIVWAAWRRISFARVYLYSLLGWLSHGLLDTFTSYGTHWFWPLDGGRISHDWISIIDPLVTIPLFVLLLVAFWTRRPRWAWLAIGWCAIYLVIGGVQHGRALDAQAQLAATRGHDIDTGRVMPSLGNLLAWRSVYLHGNRFHVDALRLSPGGEVQYRRGGDVPAFMLPAALEGSVLARDIERFALFADGYLGVLERDGERVRIGDLRYGSPPEAPDALWGIAVDLSQPQRHVRMIGWSGPDPERRERLWEFITEEDCDGCRPLAP